jgi:hypothetical protein
MLHRKVASRSQILRLKPIPGRPDKHPEVKEE